MRTILTFTLSLFLMSLSYANNNPVVEANPFSLEGANITCTLEAVDFNDNFENITINEDLGQLKFISKEKIEFVQIMNVDNEIEFQLPINSQKLALDYLDFQSGSYTVHFLINGKQDVVISSFTKK